MKVVCYYNINEFGEEQWNIVNPKFGKCIECFHSKHEAVEYANANNFNIIDWIMY